MTPASTRPGGPQLSLVMPAYNEEAIVGVTVRRLVGAFERAGYPLELIVVDNGSTDRTGEIARELALRHGEIVVQRVEVNQGYGNGVLSGLPLCTAPWVGIIPADGQVDAEDVVRLYEAATSSSGLVLAKARRRFRMDGLARKLVSIAYNVMVRLLWPKLETLDVNGLPKIMPRDVAAAMKLESRGWLLDPEILIKAHYMGLRVLELNVFARMRNAGTSHVSAPVCWEFFRWLMALRFSRRARSWRAEARRPVPVPQPGVSLSA